jgi:hypothetical protein
MEPDQQKKAWSRWDYWMLGIALLVIAPANFLPLAFGVEWIAGWPAFIGNLIALGPLMLFMLLINMLKSPLSDKLTKTRKQVVATVLAITCAAFIGALAWLNFFNGYQRKVDRYERSPYGSHRAVVLTDLWKSGTIYPVRVWPF